MFVMIYLYFLEQLYLCVFYYSGAVVSSFEDKLMGNPVGWLQELCMSRFWPPPSYHAENDDNVNRRKLNK